MRKLILAVLTCLVAFPVLAQDGLKPGDTISGRLRFFRQLHPNGTTWISVYQIAADHPRNFAEADEFCDPDNPPKTFHLVVMGNRTGDRAKKRRLDRMLGKTVSVVADAFHCSENAWQVGDAVVFDWHFPEENKR